MKDLSINPGIFRLLYADDLQIYLQVPLDQLYENLAIITLAAAQICSWAETNCLRLHAGKTKAIIFGSSHTVKRVKDLESL